MKSLVLPILVSLALAPLVACSSDAPSDAEATAEAYSTRGVVRALPDPSKPGSELQIRHEEVADFRSIDGEVVGMKSMTMPFPIDPAMLDGVAVGDRVSFDFEVRWQGSPPMKVTRLEVLPPETRLEFETAEEPTHETHHDHGQPAETPTESSDSSDETPD